MAYKPFEEFTVIPQYDISNIRKVYDIFPRLLRVKQLTSEELLNELRRQLQQKDVRIEELLSLLNSVQSGDESSAQFQSLLNDVQGALDEDIAGIINSLTEQSTELAVQQRIDSLKSSGYIQIQDTLLFAKVDYALTNTYPFNINHTDENAGFRESDLQTPYSIDIVNISKEKDYYFTKLEDWQSNDDDKRIPSAPTNAFNFSKFNNLNINPVKVSADSSISSTVKLGYNSKDDYDDAKLTRDNATNTWFGEMKLYASEEATTANTLRNSVGTPVGRMRLYRDKN